MAISVQARKAKGRNLQKHVCEKLLEKFPTLTEDDIRSCPMGSHGHDCQMSQAAKDKIIFDIECKARAKIALVYDAIEQANRDDDRVPITVIKADRKRPLVVIELSEFLKLI